MALFMPDPKTESPIELGMGLTNVPFAVPEPARREPARRAAHTRIGWYRAVSNIPHAFAIQSFVGRNGARGRARPEGLPARAARAAAPDRPARHQRHLEPWRGPDRLPDRHRPAAPRGRPRRPRRRGWGQQLAKGRGLGIAAHYSFTTYVASVVEVAVDAQGRADDPARRHRDRLRRDRQPRARALADGGRLHDGPEQRAVGRDHASRTAARSRTTSTSSRCCA